MSQKRLHWVFVLLACVLGACAQEHERLPKMQFNVEETLLGDSVSQPGYGLRYNPPVGWTPLTPGEMDQVREAMIGTHEGVVLEPIRTFFQPETEGLLSVSSLRIEGAKTFEKRMTRYGQVLREQFSDSSLQQTRFLKDDLPMEQFLVQSAGSVNFKLVVATPERRLVQFDYVVSRQHYPDELKSIESSIGSIQLID